MTEPDDRPGSDDPEDPSELLRLIGRTVPRSPHADAHRVSGEAAAHAAETAASDEHDEGPVRDEGGSVRPDAEAEPAEARDARSGPAEGAGVLLGEGESLADGRGARSRPSEGGSVRPDAEAEPAEARDAHSGPGEGGSAQLGADAEPVDGRDARSGPVEVGSSPSEVSGGPAARGAERSGNGAERAAVQSEEGTGTERDVAEDDVAEDTEQEPAGDTESGLAGGTERKPAGDTEPGLTEDTELELAEDTELELAEDPELGLTEDAELELALEALLLVVDSPIDEASLASTLDQTPSRIRQTLNRMSLAYTAERRGIDLRRAGGGWRFYTRDRYAPYVEKLLLDGQRARLTRAALETLAVVAYRQPVTRARVSAVRGVNCDGVLRTLLTRGLVEEAGTEEQTGGTLFRTTELFLERLGLSSVQELPPLAPLLPDIDAIDDLDGI